MREGEAEMWLDQERIIVSAGQSLLVPARCSVPILAHSTGILALRCEPAK